MRRVDFDELERAAARVLVSDPGSYRTTWVRRFLWSIDRTIECARKFQRSDTPGGLLAAAAVSLLEAQELPEDDDWNREAKISEARLLISSALVGLEQ